MTSLALRAISPFRGAFYAGEGRFRILTESSVCWGRLRGNELRLAGHLELLARDILAQGGGLTGAPSVFTPFGRESSSLGEGTLWVRLPVSSFCQGRKTELFGAKPGLCSENRKGSDRL